MAKKYSQILPALFISAAAVSCNEESLHTADNNNVNSFEMVLNNNRWRPSEISECEKTFMCNMSYLDNKLFYNIEAYKDPHALASTDSENRFQIQIFDVTQTGIYPINGTHKGWQSYSRLAVNDSKGKRLYYNKENGHSFRVDITEFFSSESSSIVGIRGSFSGILFNENNPLDSIQIENGQFVFRKTNWYNFNQCEQ